MTHFQSPGSLRNNLTIQKVGVDVGAKRMLWVKARPDYEPLLFYPGWLAPGFAKGAIG